MNRQRERQARGRVNSGAATPDDTRDGRRAALSAAGNRAIALRLAPSRPSPFARSEDAISQSRAAAVRRMGSGAALPDDTRREFESRFDADFSEVRICAGPKADAVARALGAAAFTSGNIIAFRDGRYSPNSGEGRKLLAHELAHVQQQRGIGATPNAGISRPSDASELEADHVATRANDPLSSSASLFSLKRPHPNRHPTSDVLQRSASEGKKDETGSGLGRVLSHGAAREHRARFERSIPKEFAVSQYITIKDVKIGIEYSLEPTSEEGANEDAFKHGVVLAPGEIGYSYEAAEAKILEHYTDRVSFKVTGDVSNKEFAPFASEVDVDGETCITSIRLDAFKWEPGSLEPEFLPLTISVQFEKWFSFPIKFWDQGFNVNSVPSFSYSVVLNPLAIAERLAPRLATITPEVIATAVEALALPAILAGVIFGSIYEFEYADEEQRLGMWATQDVVYGALSAVRALYGDTAYKGIAGEVGHRQGERALTILCEKYGSATIWRLLYGGESGAFRKIANAFDFGNYLEAARQRMVNAWTAEHKWRAELIGTPASIRTLVGDAAVEQAKSEIRGYIGSKIFKFPIPE